MKQNLFSTPVWTYHFSDADQMNQELLSVGQHFKFGENFFDIPSPWVQTLHDRVLGYCREIAEEYHWNDPPVYVHGRQHPLKPGESDTPHFHPYAKLIAVYYVQAKENSGDILLHDPRGGTFWPDPEAVTNDYRLARTFHRISPTPGKLILFPNYLQHQVEANLSDDWRISIAMEIYDFPRAWFPTHLVEGI